MDGFSRAYRDKRSPLTPITPLSLNNVFSFNLGGDGSLKPFVDQVDANRHKREACYAKQQPDLKAHVQCKPAPAEPIKCARRDVPQAQSTEKQLNPAAQCCRRVSPRAGNQQRPLHCQADPRLTTLLCAAGMAQYIKLFAQAQVDYKKFRTLNQTDLVRLGVTSSCDCKFLLYVIDKVNHIN